VSAPVSPDSVASRRSAILTAAAGEMVRARTRRIRRARTATALALIALGATVAIVLQRAVPTSTDHPKTAHRHAIDFQVTGTTAVAIDYATVGYAPSSLDFAIVQSTDAPVLDTLTDAEAEQALAEAGYCVKIFRVQDNPMLVDCSTGARAVLDPQLPIAR
jgi:hypothetical protein